LTRTDIRSRRNHFKTNVNVGVNYSIDQLNTFDSIVLCGWLYDKQNLPTKGIESKGVVQAMTFLTQQTKSLYGEEIPNQILERM
jgi:glutamate synthase (NADPH/NADH) small chain